MSRLYHYPFPFILSSSCWSLSLILSLSLCVLRLFSHNMAECSSPGAFVCYGAHSNDEDTCRTYFRLPFRPKDASFQTAVVHTHSRAFPPFINLLNALLLGLFECVCCCCSPQISLQLVSSLTVVIFLYLSFPKHFFFHFKLPQSTSPIFCLTWGNKSKPLQLVCPQFTSNHSRLPLY